MNFWVGQKVVCIDTSDWTRIARPRWQLPVRGPVYTVREVAASPINGEQVIRLSEIVNDIVTCPKTGLSVEPYFRADRFRPVVDDTDKLAWARKLVEPGQVTVKPREIVHG